MRFPPAPVPFTERITCIGTLSAEGRTTGPLDILIDVSNTAAHRIRGWVLGNEATREDIERAQGEHRGSMRLNAGTGSEILISESIWIRTTQSLRADRRRMPHGLHGIVCAFDCLDLTRRFEGGEGDTKEPREVRFLLRGPSVSGLVEWTHEYSFDGTTKVKVLGGGRVATGGGLQFSMFMRPHFLHDGVGGRRVADDNEPRETNATSETNVRRSPVGRASRPMRTATMHFWLTAQHYPLPACPYWIAVAVWSVPRAAKQENRRGDSSQRVRSL